MVPETIKKMLEAGVHFGHQAKKWNPKMKKFIFGKRSGIYIIDLEKTVKYLEKAKEFLRELTSRGGSILFVGTKRQFADIIKTTAEKCGMYYVNEKWVGGLLTNFQTIKNRLQEFKRLLEEKEQTDFQNYSKKERARLLKELDRMAKKYSGVKDMQELPDALVIIDPSYEDLAVREARRLKIPIVALIDTNGDPEVIDYPIPGNDDAMRSVKLILELLLEPILEGINEFRKGGKVKITKEETPDTQVSTSEEELELISESVEEDVDKEMNKEEHP